MLQADTKLPHEGHVPTLPGRTNTGERYINFNRRGTHKTGSTAPSGSTYRAFGSGNLPGRAGPPREFIPTLDGFIAAITYRDAILANYPIAPRPERTPTEPRGPGRIHIPADFPMPRLQNRAFVESLVGEIEVDDLYKKEKERRASKPKPVREGWYVAYLYVLKWYDPETQELVMGALKRGISTKKGLEKRFGEAYRFGADVDVISLDFFDTYEESLTREAELNDVARDLGGIRWSHESYFVRDVPNIRG